ncbi:MAG: aspartate 1-decarboxylase [Flavobacteriaceae bacterium]|nr:aspartate 1-decarboxylase [Flavobacteriaceae bacterium]
MDIHMLKCKIHNATVTEANLKYVGSITIDSNLLDAAGMLEYEKVQVVNGNNGARIETYTFRGEPGSGIICLNGAAARHFEVGDEIIIMSYCQLDAEEAKQHRPTVVLVDKSNDVTKVGNYEENGVIA